MLKASEIDWFLLTWGLITVIPSVLLASCIEPMIVWGNSTLIEVLVTVFSIFAGFAVTIMAISSEYKKSNHIKKTIRKKEAMKTKLSRYQFLFFTYSICLISIAVCVEGELGQAILDEILADHENFADFLKRVAIMICSCALLVSMIFPISLKKSCLEEIEQDIEDKLNNSA